MPAYHDFHAWVREQENRDDCDKGYTPHDWQTALPELAVDLTWYHLMNIRPHGAVNMVEARNICRLEMPKMPRVDMDKLIMLSYRHMRDELSIPKEGVWLEYVFDHFPLIYYRAHPLVTWGLLNTEVYDDIDTKMRTIIDVSISASANGALLRYNWAS